MHLYCWSIENCIDVLDKFKISNYQASSISTYNISTSISTYDISTLYTTLPHNLINEKLNALIEKKTLPGRKVYTLHVILLKFYLEVIELQIISYGPVMKFVKLYPFC